MVPPHSNSKWSHTNLKTENRCLVELHVAGGNAKVAWAIFFRQTFFG
ncbi:hypothetical protein V3C99_002571 [Haemonchus contortus]